MSVLKFRNNETGEWQEIITIKGDTGAPGQDGAPGRDGIDGKDGADGKDYVLTDADKQEIAGMIDVPGGGGSGECNFDKEIIYVPTSLKYSNWDSEYNDKMDAFKTKMLEVFSNLRTMREKYIFIRRAEDECIILNANAKSDTMIEFMGLSRFMWGSGFYTIYGTLTKAQMEAPGSINDSTSVFTEDTIYNTCVAPQLPSFGGGGSWTFTWDMWDSGFYAATEILVCCSNSSSGNDVSTTSYVALDGNLGNHTYESYLLPNQDYEEWWYYDGSGINCSGNFSFMWAAYKS